MQTKAHPWGTLVRVAHGRHELPQAYLLDSDRVAGGGRRYQAIFPVENDIVMAKVYDDEILEVVANDPDGALELLTADAHRNPKNPSRTACSDG